MNAERIDKIRNRLEAALSPAELQIKDQSHLHAGHAGAEDGRGHFEVTIVAQAFEGCGRVQRHRLVYDALAALLDTDIHALKINAFTPAQRQT